VVVADLIPTVKSIPLALFVVSSVKVMVGLFSISAEVRTVLWVGVIPVAASTVSALDTATEISVIPVVILAPLPLSDTVPIATYCSVSDTTVAFEVS
jgi:hypothetical protein